MKKIKAAYYFIDIGAISLLAIFGFAFGISRWIGVIGIFLITLFSISTTLHCNKKYWEE